MPILLSLQQHYWPIITISYLKQRQSLSLPTSGPLIFHYVMNTKFLKLSRDSINPKATGCDGISVKALKLAAPNISQSLSHLLNESLRTGQFPCLENSQGNTTTTTLANTTLTNTHKHHHQHTHQLIVTTIDLFRYCPVF